MLFNCHMGPLYLSCSKSCLLTLWSYGWIINDEQDLTIRKPHLTRLNFFGIRPL